MIIKKKRVAKEVLNVFAVLGVGILTLLVILVVTFVQGRNENRQLLKKEMYAEEWQILHNEIGEKYDKQAYFYSATNNTNGTYADQRDLWLTVRGIVDAGEVYTRWNGKWRESGAREEFIKLGLKSPDEVISHWRRYSYTDEELGLYQKLETAGKNRDYWQRMASDTELLKNKTRSDIPIWIAFTMIPTAVILFPLRYLWMLLKWSLRESRA